MTNKEIKAQMKRFEKCCGRKRDVSEADALREGFENKREFLDYFEKINPEMKGQNPKVVAIGFKVLAVKNEKY